MKTYKFLLPDTFVTVQAENAEEAAKAAMAKFISELKLEDFIGGDSEGSSGGTIDG